MSRIGRILIGAFAVFGAVSSLHPLGALIVPTGQGDAWSDAEFQQEVLYRIILGVSAFSASVLGLWVVVRASEQRSHRVFALFLASFGLAAADEGRFEFVKFLLPQGVVISHIAGELAYAALFGACLASAFRWAQLYPNDAPHPKPDPKRGWCWKTTVFGFLSAPMFAWLGIGLGSAAILAATAVSGERTLAQIACAVIVLATCAKLLRNAYKVAVPDQQRRMFWILQAAVVSLVLLLASLPVEIGVHFAGSTFTPVLWLHASLLPLSLCSLVMFLCVAVLYSGAVDPVLVVRKTILYSGAGLLVTCVFVAVETVASALIETWLALPEAIASWIAGMAAALTFGPLKSFVDKVLSGSPTRGALAAALGQQESVVTSSTVRKS